MAKKDILYIFARLLLGFWLCFGSLNVAQGAQVQNQTVYDNVSPLSSGDNGLSQYQTLGNVSGTVTGVDVYIRSDIAVLDPSKYINCGIGLIDEGSGNFGGWIASGYATSGQFASSSVFYLTHFDFTAPSTQADLSISTAYKLICGDGNSPAGSPQGNVHFAVGGSTANTYALGEARRKKSPFGTEVNSPLSDMYFVWQFATPPESIDISFPANGTTIDDFLSWNVDYNVSSTGDIVIDYSSQSSSTFEFSESPTPTFATGTQVIGIAKSRYLVVPIFPDPIKWYARARYIVASTTILTSPVISFYINPTPVSFTLPSSTNLTATSTCIFGDSAFSEGACGFFFAIFVPPTSTVMLFTSLKDVLILKPPLGYFSLVVDDLSQLSEGTSTYAILSASATIALSPLFSPVRNSIYSLLWLSFAMWLLIKFRNFEP